MTPQHVAIYGCGQLAQMTAKAGSALGLSFAFIAEPGEDFRCVEHLGEVVLLEPEMSAEALFEALHKPQVISVEKEMVDSQLLQDLAALTMVSPSSEAVFIAQNRIREKTFIREQGFETAQFEKIDTIEQLKALAQTAGLPLYVKAAEAGYDGYHQWRIKTDSDLEQPALLKAIESGVELIAEAHVDFIREVSIIAARSYDDSIVYYPVMENRHEGGVLLSTIAPAPELKESLQSDATAMMAKLLRAMDYVGVLTIECFETKDGLVVNELAPRVHNSGHWSIEGSQTSQFENHCRAIMGMPLGSTKVNGVCGMVNMLGKHGDRAEFAHENTFYHAYGKEERARRKLGHITLLSDELEVLQANVEKAINALYADVYEI